MNTRRNYFRASMLALFTPALLFVCLIVGNGCQVVPVTRSQTAATRVADSITNSAALNVSRVVEGTAPAPAPNVTVSGSSNTVTITPPAPPAGTYKTATTVSQSASAAAVSQDAANSEWKTAIPWGVSLILAGVGILVIVFAIRKVRQSSTAVNAAFATADGMIAARIRAWRERATVSTDNAEIAQLNGQIAAAEADRGRLASTR